MAPAFPIDVAIAVPPVEQDTSRPMFKAVATDVIDTAVSSTGSLMVRPVAAVLPAAFVSITCASAAPADDPRNSHRARSVILFCWSFSYSAGVGNAAPGRWPSAAMPAGGTTLDDEPMNGPVV